MALYNVLFDIDSAIGNSGKKLVGVDTTSEYSRAMYAQTPANCVACHATGDSTEYVHAMQNITQTDCNSCHVAGGIQVSGSAMDQISAASTITPDILNMPWVQDMYNPIAGMALSLFGTLLLFAAALYVWGLMKEDNRVNAEIIVFIKRSFIEFPAIYFGLDIIAGCLNANMLLSTMFGGSVNINKLLWAGFMEPSGLLIFAYAIGAALTAWFYICRYYLLIVCILLWSLGCILRIFELTRPTGMLILRITMINIFLGTWMCVCFAAGAWITGTGTNILTSWGTSILGLIVMYCALSVPRKLWNSQISNGLERTGKKAVTYVKMVV